MFINLGYSLPILIRQRWGSNIEQVIKRKGLTLFVKDKKKFYYFLHRGFHSVTDRIMFYVICYDNVFIDN
jgi:hypothetical protein